MPVFKTADKLYTVMQPMFDTVLRDNAAAFAELIKNRLTVRFKTSDPVAEFTLDGKQRPPKVTLGAGGARPDIALDLSGDTLDRLLRHEISATKAVTDGTIKFKGNPFRLRALLDVIKACNAVYVAQPAKQLR